MRSWSFQRGDTTGVRLEHVRLSGPTIQQRILSRNSSALEKGQATLDRRSDFINKSLLTFQAKIVTFKCHQGFAQVLQPAGGKTGRPVSTRHTELDTCSNLSPNPKSGAGRRVRWWSLGLTDVGRRTDMPLPLTPF